MQVDLDGAFREPEPLRYFLVGQPFGHYPDDLAFTPELAAEMVRRNTQTTGEGGRINRYCNVPGGMVFLTRITFGLTGLLATLGAQGPWRAIVAEYIDDAPPATHLGRLSAASSSGAPV